MRIKFLPALLPLLASPAFCDGWSEAGLASPVKIQTVTAKDNGAVIVKFVGVARHFYFVDNKNLLSTVLAAKAEGASVRAWTKTSTSASDHSVEDIPGGSSGEKAHYLGAVQVQE